MPRKTAVAIVGSGPVGLAAAAHAYERGLAPIVLEAGPEIAYAVRQWEHVRLFSPWEYNVDRAAERLLGPIGWNSPAPADYPTGAELIDRYLDPLATRSPLKEFIHTSSRVTGISRVSFDKLKSKGRELAAFELQYKNGRGVESIRADAVIDASGTWFSPAPAGANGLEAIGEKETADKIAYGMPDVLGKDRERYDGKTVAVLGSGHSAAGTLIELTRLKQQAPATTLLWLLRGNNPAKAFGGGPNDKLAARGELGTAFAAIVSAGLVKVETEFRVSHLSFDEGRLRIGSNSGKDIIVDELIVATGFRSDFDFLREIRLRLDPSLECPPSLASLIDPNEHSCGTVRPHGAHELSAQDEPGFYLAGMKSYGRAPTFLMITGYEQVRSIIAEIAGDHEAAARMELVLPETGVCNLTSVASEFVGCCSGPASTEAACCAQDAAAKQEGKTGCGCS